jgi:hypothetical protein
MRARRADVQKWVVWCMIRVSLAVANDRFDSFERLLRKPQWLNAEVKSITLPDGPDACPHRHGGELSGQGDVPYLARL